MKKLLALLLLIGLALAGVAWWLNQKNQHGPEASEYTTLPVEHGAIRDVVSATGLVQPRQTFPVGTELAGKVVAVLADYNQTVAEGDVLLRLDDRMARQRLDEARVGVTQAEAGRDTAQKAAQRARNLSPEVRNHWDVELAESQVRRAQAAVEAAQVKVREAELGLSLTTVRVPVLSRPAQGSASAAHPERTGVGTLSEGKAPSHKQSFIVLDRKVSLNQEIGPPASALLFTLAGDMARMRVLTQVVEGDVGKIRRGLSADFTVAGGGENAPTFHGTVEEIRLVPTSERGAVFYTVVLNAPNRKGDGSGEWLLRPGLTASVDVIRQVHNPVWKLPSAALNVQQPDDGLLTPAAKEKLARWQSAPDREQWRAVWVIGPENKPWPIFVRVGGTNAKGEPGLQDAQYTEVLAWDPELKPLPEPADKATYPRVIIGLPPPKKSGFFNMPTIKF